MRRSTRLDFQASDRCVELVSWAHLGRAVRDSPPPIDSLPSCA